MTTWTFQSSRGHDGLAALRAEWEALAATDARLAFYQCAVWAQAYLDHLAGEPAHLVWVSGRRDGVLALVLPLERVGRDLRLLTHDHMTLADVLAPGANTDANADADVWPALWQWLGSPHGPGCARLQVPALTSAATLAGWLDRHAPALALQRELEGCARLRCDASYDTLLKGASANHRSNLSRGQKRAAQRGGLRYETHAGEAGVAGALQSFLDIEASGWKGQAGGAVACRPELVAFYAALGAGFGAQGRCEIDLLWLGDRAIATVFWFRTGATLHLQKIAYLEEFADLGPGRLIMAEALRRVCDDPGLDQISFITRCPWADGWRTEVLPVHAWVLFPDTASGRVSHGLALMRARLKAMIKPWLARLRR